MNEKDKEKVRQAIEKRLWKEYDPWIAPNMEELSEDIIRIMESYEKDQQ